jgi:PKD domain-containing protein
MRLWMRCGLSCLITLIVVLGTTAAASACTLDNVASAAANGQRAILSSDQPQAGKPWAPFRFAQAYAVGTTITLSEDHADLAKSLSPTMLVQPFRWVLGDGSSMRGTSVTHAFKRAGTYVVQVYAYAASAARWVLFDAIQIEIVPGGQLWQANLGYHALQLVDFGAAWLGRIVTAALTVLLLYTVVAYFRRQPRSRADRPDS